MRPDRLIGTEVDGYLITDVVGSGASGTVYRALDSRLNRPVALKLLSADLASHPRVRERFLAEWKTIASLSHANIIPVYHAGEIEDLMYLAMKLVDGHDLTHILRERGTLSPRTLVGVIHSVASALDAAHDRGIVHRDVKPGNILVGREDGPDAGHVYLCDFGLAKGVTSDPSDSSGYLLGTLHYAAPEQINADAVDRRTDVYSLTCVVFECLTGHVPFRRRSEVAILDAHRYELPPRVTTVRPDLSRKFDQIVATGMAKRPQDRYAKASELEGAVLTALRDRLEVHPTAPRWSLVLAAIIVGAGLMVATYVIATAVMG